jgi:hypothetical protein
MNIDNPYNGLWIVYSLNMLRILVNVQLKVCYRMWYAYVWS